MKEYMVYVYGFVIWDKKLGYIGKGDKLGELEVVWIFIVRLL